MIDLELRETRMTHQTPDIAQALANMGHESTFDVAVDVFDPQGEVARIRVCTRRGRYYVVKGSRDPRNLYNRLKRDLRVTRLVLCVAKGD
jgi:hypothetical protein